LAALTDFRRLVLPDVVGCPVTTVDNAIRGALREFCTRSWILRKDLTPIDTVIDQAEYTLTPPTDNRILGPVYVGYEDEEIFPRTEEQLDRQSRSWRNSASGTPYCYVVLETNKLRLYPPPAKAVTGGLDVRLAVAPTNVALTVDDFLYDDWEEVIAQGALYRLLKMAKKAWSDQIAAGFNYQLYRQGMGRAGIEAEQGRVRVNNVVTPVPFL